MCLEAYVCYRHHFNLTIMWSDVSGPGSILVRANLKALVFTAEIWSSHVDGGGGGEGGEVEF